MEQKLRESLVQIARNNLPQDVKITAVAKVRSKKFDVVPNCTEDPRLSVQEQGKHGSSVTQSPLPSFTCSEILPAFIQAAHSLRFRLERDAACTTHWESPTSTSRACKRAVRKWRSVEVSTRQDVSQPHDLFLFYNVSEHEDQANITTLSTDQIKALASSITLNASVLPANLQIKTEKSGTEPAGNIDETGGPSCRYHLIFKRQDHIYHFSLSSLFVHQHSLHSCSQVFS